MNISAKETKPSYRIYYRLSPNIPDYLPAFLTFFLNILSISFPDGGVFIPVIFEETRRILTLPSLTLNPKGGLLIFSKKDLTNQPALVHLGIRPSSKLHLVFKVAMLLEIISCSPLSSVNDAKIIGGQKINAAPYMANLFTGLVNENPVCGGALVAKNIVLTAAECVRKHKIKTVSLGGDKSNNKVSVIDTLIHPNYMPNKVFIPNNIALIKINDKEMPAAFNQRFVKIRQIVGNSYLSQNYFFLGRGKKSSYGRINDKSIHGINFAPLSRHDCKESLATSFDSKQEVFNDQICGIANYESGQDTCSGDLGGPLLDFESGQPYIVGLLAFGEKCGQDSLPNIFTRIDSHYDWLIAEIEKLETDNLKVDAESLKFQIRRNCKRKIETATTQKFPNGFISTITNYDLNNIALKDADYNTYNAGVQIEVCKFEMLGQTAVAEFRKDSNDAINGILLFGQKKWAIKPKKIKRKLLSCNQGSDKIDIEWYPDEPISTIYTQDGEYYALPQKNFRTENGRCLIGDYSLAMTRNISGRAILTVNGPDIWGGRYYGIQKIKRDLDVEVIKNYDYYEIIIKNNLDSRLFGVEINCGFSFKALNQDIKLYSYQSPSGKHSVIFDKNHPSLWGLKESMVSKINLIPDNAKTSWDCSLNGRQIPIR